MSQNLAKNGKKRKSTGKGDQPVKSRKYDRKSDSAKIRPEQLLPSTSNRSKNQEIAEKTGKLPVKRTLKYGNKQKQTKDVGKNNNAQPTIEQSVQTRSIEQTDVSAESASKSVVEAEAESRKKTPLKQSKNDKNELTPLNKSVKTPGKNGNETDVIDHDGIELSVSPSQDDFRDPNPNRNTETAMQNSDITEVSEEEQEDSSSSEESSEGEITDSEDESSSDDEAEAVYQMMKKVKKDPKMRMAIDVLVQEKLKKAGKKKRKTGKVTKGNAKINDKVSKFKPNTIKSPSDSTLYTPALKRAPIVPIDNQDNVINKISQFVENIRMDSEKNEHKHRRQSREDSQERGESSSSQCSYKTRNDEDNAEYDARKIEKQQRRMQPNEEEARNLADKLVLDSEQFKASLVAPQGMLPITIDKNIELLRKLDNNDDFFHVSCHIESNMREKIERGDFVDLEALLPKEKSAGGISMNENLGRIGIFQEGGKHFWLRLRELTKLTQSRGEIPLLGYMPQSSQRQIQTEQANFCSTWM